MARDYGRISTAFWNSQDIRSLGDRGKLLASYLLTGPHSNMIGAYLLPDAYMADDLGWDIATVRETLGELFAKGFAARFKDGRHIVVCKFLEWNPIENPNVAVAAMKLAEQLPDDGALSHVLKGFELYAKHFRNGLETLSERLPKPFPNQEQEQEQEPEQKQETSQSSVGAVAPVVEVIPKAVPVKEPIPGRAKLPPFVPEKSWADFVEMRRKIRAPMTGAGMDKIIAKLRTLHDQGEDVGAVLDASVENSWRGVFPVKQNQGGRNGGKSSNQSFGSSIVEVVAERRSGRGLFGGDGAETGDAEPVRDRDRAEAAPQLAWRNPDAA